MVYLGPPLRAHEFQPFNFKVTTIRIFLQDLPGWEKSNNKKSAAARLTVEPKRWDEWGWLIFRSQFLLRDILELLSSQSSVPAVRAPRKVLIWVISFRELG